MANMVYFSLPPQYSSICVALQVDSAAMQNPTELATTITSLVSSKIADNEFRVGEEGELMVPRRVDASEQNKRISDIVANKEVIENTPLGMLESTSAMGLTIKNPGILDSLHFSPVTNYTSEPDLADDAIEIQVQASGVNFRDVLVAMGKIPDETMGFEASGIVTAKDS